MDKNLNHSSKVVLPSTYNKGKSQEFLAKEFLLKKGFVLLKENYLLRCGEIDLICLDGENSQRPTLVFVEVRSSLKVNKLLRYSIGFHKRKRLKKTAQLFILKHKYQKFSFRFDVIWIENNRIEHWTNIEI